MNKNKPRTNKMSTRSLRLLALFSGTVMGLVAWSQTHVTFDTRDPRFQAAQGQLPASEQMIRSFPDMQAYQQWKQGNSGRPVPAAGTLASETKGPGGSPGVLKGGGVGTCECWKEPDTYYTLIDNETEWNANGFNNPDDGSYGPIALPFQFFLYGQFWDVAYININGNVSFGTYYGTYTAQGFPVADFTMVAPFWTDVDLAGTGCGDCNTVEYFVTSTALYVNWTRVGYYNDHTDKLNTFQLIISDGNDPVIPEGNVSFCYKDMQWTEGDVTGTNGFGGSGASVGANHGNGVDYLQFGRFDHEGVDYDGPFGVNDGVSWLDDQYFTFATDTTTGNVPPVISGQSVCSDLTICSGQVVDLSVSFYSPEPDQTTTANSTSDLGSYTIVSNTAGTTATISTTFTATDLDIGTHYITFSGTDDGTPVLTSTLEIVVTVLPGPDAPPEISGDSTACADQGTVLTADGNGLENYTWSNGYNGQTVLVGEGTYTVTVGAGDCLFTSEPFTVVEVPSPQPVIEGDLFSCGGQPATLSTSEAYPQYLWSNGSTENGITVGTGDYYVTVTDDEGCTANSSTVSVLSANDPVAGISSDSPSSVFPGATIVYTSTSTVDGSTIVSTVWYLDSTQVSTSGSFTYLFEIPGTYTITVTVTSADGCTNSFSYVQIVIPTEIVVPNVFSPNGDGENDFLEFTGVEYYPNSHLSVYNRWGQEIFTSTSYKNTWRAPDVAEGTYYYVLKLQGGKEYTGHVTLLR